MACFTPKNNGYCLPNVDAFLDRLTECKQVTGGMTWVELLTRLCFVHASLIASAICVTVFLMEPMIVDCTLITGPELEMFSTSVVNFHGGTL